MVPHISFDSLFVPSWHRIRSLLFRYSYCLIQRKLYTLRYWIMASLMAFLAEASPKGPYPHPYPYPYPCPIPVHLTLGGRKMNPSIYCT